MSNSTSRDEEEKSTLSAMFSLLFAFPLGMLLTAAALANLLRSGYHVDVAGAPQVILDTYERMRDATFGLISNFFPATTVPTTIQDVMLAWFFTAFTNYALFTKTNYPKQIEETAREKSRYVRMADFGEGLFLHYPWILQSLWFVVLLGPIMYGVLLYKILFPHYIVESEDARQMVRRALVRDTLKLWGALLLSLLGTALLLYWQGILKLDGAA